MTRGQIVSLRRPKFRVFQRRMRKSFPQVAETAENRHKKTGAKTGFNEMQIIDLHVKMAES